MAIPSSLSSDHLPCMPLLDRNWPRPPTETDRHRLPHKTLPAGCPHAEAGIRILKLRPIAQEQTRPTAPGMAKVHPAEPIVVRLVRWRRHVQPLVARIAQDESTVEGSSQLAVDGSGHLVVNCTGQDAR